MTPAQSYHGVSAEQRADIRARLASGKLPLRSAKQKVYGGYGENQLCDICGGRIGKSDAAYEIEPYETEPYKIEPREQSSQTHPREQSSQTHPLARHYACFAAWVVESGSLTVSDRHILEEIK
jgi:hypothetical protein